MIDSTTELLKLFKMNKVALKKIIREEKLNLRVTKNISINDLVSRIWAKRTVNELKTMKKQLDAY